MRGRDTGLPEDRVRRALAELGADASSAPDVPRAVTARIGAALRSAPPAHAASDFSRMSRRRVVALVVGIVAAAVALALGLALLLHSSPAPRFPSGPTAETITVSRPPADTPNPVVTHP